MQRTGEITAVHGEWLEVTFCRPTDCEKCHACGPNGPKTASVRVKGKGQIGDMAVVEMPTRTVVKASVMAYALPLAGLLGGMFIASAVFPEETTLAPLLGGLIGLAIPLGWIKISEKARSQSKAWQPQLIDVIPHKQ